MFNTIFQVKFIRQKVPFAVVIEIKLGIIMNSYSVYTPRVGSLKFGFNNK